MEGECKVLLDATFRTARRETMRVNPSSKQTTALLMFILCLGAAASVVLVFYRHKGQRQDEDNFGLHHTLRQIANVRAAIHLDGHYNSAVNSSAEWKNKVDQSHSHGGLELKNNQIVIPQNGLYFVYSQASFRVNCSSSNDDDASSQPIVHVSHTVKRWSRSLGNKDWTILHSIRSVCQMEASINPDEEENRFSSVYMGALFNLRKGDRLRTVMEEKMLQGLEDESGKTFFGVFAL